jgi:methylthioribose-1-phosphate isomerase
MKERHRPRSIPIMEVDVSIWEWRRLVQEHLKECRPTTVNLPRRLSTARQVVLVHMQFCEASSEALNSATSVETADIPGLQEPSNLSWDHLIITRFGKELFATITCKSR